jgi:ribonuclease HI
MKSEKEYIIYTDGACSGNPGPGGWGAIVLDSDDRVIELGSGELGTTNNRMEMSGALFALRSISEGAGKITIFTDSTYLIRGITQWAWGWRKNNWRTSTGDEVSNRDLWEDLTSALGRLKGTKISWLYVRGHKGTAGNERCDEIAVAFSKGKRVGLYKGDYASYGIDIKSYPPVEELPDMKKSYEKKTAYSYLSVIGGQLKKHKDWASCERRVKGQSGARFKKAMDSMQEKEIVASWGFDPDKVPTEE